MLSLRIELPARHIDEGAIGQSNKSVTVRRHGAWCGLLGLAAVAANPNGRCLDALRF
jgi:hypothetical protein